MKIFAKRHYCFLTCLYSRDDALMVERQGKSLIEAGFKVTYLVCDKNPDTMNAGINIISTGFVPKNRIDRFLHSKTFLLKKVKDIDADVFQFSDPELISLVKPLKEMGKKVIYNLREFYPEMIKGKTYIPKFVRYPLSRHYEWMMKRYLPIYDAVFVVSPEILYVVKDLWGVVNSYTITNFPRVHKNFSLSKEEYFSRGDVLNYEGTIYHESNQELVLDALQNIGNIRYLLVGKFSNEEQKRKLMHHSYWKNVEFIEGFSLNQLPSIFSRSSMANVFRDMGKNQGSLGIIKIFESMEAGLPVLLADVPLYRKINKKWHCGICVNPSDEKSIETAIRYLVEHKDVAYEMGQNGRRAVIEEFSWEKQALKYIGVIESLIN